MAIGAVLGGLASSALDFAGSKYAARKGEQLAREQMAWNAKQAQINRDFQKEMSNTAYRRSAADLEAAGLNRIIALHNPASTPGGATAAPTDLASSARPLAELGKSGSKAIAAAQGVAQVGLTNAAAAKNKADADLAEARTETEKNKGTITSVPADAIEMSTDWIKETTGMDKKQAMAVLGTAGFVLTLSPLGRIIKGTQWAIKNAPRALAYLGKMLKQNEVRIKNGVRQIRTAKGWQTERQILEAWKKSGQAVSP